MPIIRQGQTPVESKTDAEDPLGGFTAHLISDAGGLTQFGAFTETLEPGARSSLQHWHAQEDEMIYVLSGVVTLHEGDTSAELMVGDAACFVAGADTAHCLENATQEPVTYLVIGTRAKSDVVTYPRHDRRLFFDRTTNERRYETLKGKPADRPKS